MEAVKGAISPIFNKFSLLTSINSFSINYLLFAIIKADESIFLITLK